MARISIISLIVKTTLSYLFTGLACLAYALALQVVFEWATVGPQWATFVTFTTTTLVAAIVHYLDRFLNRSAPRPFKDLRRLKLATVGVGAALPVVMLLYLTSEHVVSTGASQFERMNLADGSVVDLDAHSKIKVAYSPSTRMVRLYRGTAVFDVARDPKRPFIVRTDLVDATAAGTRFGVSIDSGVITTVAEGIVKVSRRGEDNDAPVSVTADQELRVSDRSPPVQHLVRVDAHRKLDWVTGWLTLVDSTVAEGVEQFNRRNRTQIVVEGSTLSATRLRGYLHVRVDSPESYAQFVSSQTGANMIVDKQGRVIWLRE
jgi:transmembrane sensor